MKIDLKLGSYIIAVSGGVDSVVLLDLLAKYHGINPGYQFIVAHFDHGIRPDSDDDRKFVEKLSNNYGLKFESKREELGKDASEELARDHRYKFLNAVKQKYGADGLITAHHRDDVIETAAINISRGTNRRGITSLASGEVSRPLLEYSKKQILDYADKHKLSWREDATNSDQKYLRNKVRARLEQADETMLRTAQAMIQELGRVNKNIDSGVAEIFESIRYDESSILRSGFISLGYKLSNEILATWLRSSGVEYDKNGLQRMVVALKTAQIGAKIDAGSGHYFKLSKKHISLHAS